MRKQIEVVTCDICHKEAECANINYPVLFYTDQTEGRSCEPYIDRKTIDVCGECLGQILRLKGTGAQGYNTYEIIQTQKLGEILTVVDKDAVQHHRCSECGEELGWEEYPKYCSNCGTKFRRVRDEQHIQE